MELEKVIDEEVIKLKGEKKLTVGLKFVFEDNLITMQEDSPPLFVFNASGDLTQVNLKGYIIKPR